MNESAESQAAKLIGKLNYQIFRPDVSTMGQCPRCRNVSRGSLECWSCLNRDLAQIVGSVLAENYTSTALTLAEARTAIYLSARALDEPL